MTKRAPIKAGRGDLAQKARDAVSKLPWSRESRELDDKHRREAAERIHATETLYVIVHGYPGGVRAEVISGQKDGCPAFDATGPDEPSTLRRLKGAYLDALHDNRIARGEAARARARSCKIEVLDRQVHAPEPPKIISS